MLSLEQVPLFDGLSEAGRERLRAVARLREVPAGSLVLRRGAPGRDLWIVASGGVRVRPELAAPELALGPGEVLGEMSLVAGQRISATVTAAKDSRLWCVPGVDFLALVEAEPALAAQLLRGLARRLRQREAGQAAAAAPQVVLLERTPELAPALRAGVARHLESVELERVDAARAAQDVMLRWRSGAAREDLLLLELPASELDAAQRALEAGDGLLCSTEPRAGGLADSACFRFGPPRAGERWAFPLEHEELVRVGGGATPSRAETPRLDRLARWIARKEVGIALGAGAARGFAHLGVLAELEALGLPVDRLAGTSMGGIAALLHGLAGTGERGIELAAETLGRPRPARWRWLPRGALLSDRELRRRAWAVAGGRAFADLCCPVAVVASDLVRGERSVIDQGRVAEAFFATSAVPGVLPAVAQGGRVLVDGALVNRLPLGLLPRSRSALRIAVNVVPAPEEVADTERAARELVRRFARPFGFREVLGRSWQLLSWVHGARDAADADLLFEPRTHDYSGLDFSRSWRALVEAGRAAVRDQAGELRALAAELFGPDVSSPVPS